MKKEVLGAWGESMAARHYRNRGYTLLGSRYRTRFGEIDLVACKKKMIVFVEVKTRSKKRIAEPVSYTHLDVYKRQERVWRHIRWRLHFTNRFKEF